MNKGNTDMVNRPAHYQSEAGLEVIDVIEAFTSDLTGIEATDTGNIIKYICRWKKKNGLQDLEKAAWYLNHLIEHVKAAENYEVPRPKYTSTTEHTDIRIVFSDIFSADAFRCDLKRVIEGHGKLTLADLHSMLGRNYHYKDAVFGWRSIDDMDMVVVAEDIVELMLPAPVKIKNR